MKTYQVKAEYFDDDSNSYERTVLQLTIDDEGKIIEASEVFS